jgi:hypothetical protein
MKFPGRIYQGKNSSFVAVYNTFSDVYVAAPPSLKGKAKRIAHVAYSNGGCRNGIDIFRTTRRLNLKSQLEGIELNLPIRIGDVDGRRLRSVDKKQDVGYEFISLPAKQMREIKKLVNADIEAFCERPAKRTGQGGVKCYPKIIPKTAARYIEYSPDWGMLTSGKQEFVGNCILEANLDFSKGCLTGWRPAAEGGEASFDGTTFKNFFLDPSSECDYCYAESKHKTFPKTIYRMDKDRLREELLGGARLVYGSDETYGKRVQVLRLGKRTEAGSLFTRDALVSALEVCLETGTKTIFPTKFLRFDSTIAELLKRTHSTTLFSMGWDEREKGAQAHGCDNDFRVRQAIKYNEAGVNSSLYLLIHPNAPPTTRDRSLIEVAKNHNLPIQLLPERFKSKVKMKRATGMDWDIAKKPLCGKRFSGISIASDEYAGTYKVSAGSSIPEVIHPAWRSIIGNNNELVRMCHHNSETVWCGGCFAEDGAIGKMKHVERTTVDKPSKTKKDPELPLLVMKYSSGDKTVFVTSDHPPKKS